MNKLENRGYGKPNYMKLGFYVILILPHHLRTSAGDQCKYNVLLERVGNCCQSCLNELITCKPRIKLKLIKLFEAYVHKYTPS